MDLLRHKWWMWTALGAILLVSTSCVVATRKTGTTVVEKAETMLKGTYHTSDAFAKHKPRTVAILPFVDESGKKEAPEVVRRCFYNHFSSLPYYDMELFRVDSVLRSKGITKASQLKALTPQQLGVLLKVDAVIYGVITHFDRLYAVIVSDIAVGARLRMVDTRTGLELWRGEHVAHMPTGGIATTPVGLILTALSTAYNLRTINLYRTSDDLFREMVKAIPRPTLAEAEQPPRIRMLAQDAAFSVKKAGDVIKVAMEGDPRMRASFDIGSFKKGLPMREVSPGNYVGEYRVVPGDNVKKALVIGYLTNEAGVTSQWIDALGYVNIDTTPPRTPEGFTESSREGAVYLSWKPNPEADMAKYRLYRSATPLTGYTLLAEVEEPEYLDSGLENFKPYYYRISAVDLAGNESERSAQIRGMGIPKGPTPVGGELKEHTVWYAAASPYVLEREVFVPDRIRLTIEPGTTVVSKGPGIRVQGILRAKGTEKRVITFRGEKGVPWSGLVLESKGTSEAAFCTVKGADIGVLIRSGAVSIRNCEISGNRVGLRIEGAHTRPLLEANSIMGNRAAGVEILSGAAPRLQGNRITNNAGPGIRAVAASPVIRNNEIVHNKGGGLLFRQCGPEVVQNSIHDNGAVDLINDASSQTVRARENYWGSSEGERVVARIKGRVDFNPVLGGPPPRGRPVKLSILDSRLGGTLKHDAFLIPSKSPYRLSGRLVVDNGAVLHIESGVAIRYTSREALIVVRKGGIHARGTPQAPILFTSGSASPGPGDYATAIRFLNRNPGGIGRQIRAGVERLLGRSVESHLAYCVFAYADTPLDVHHGSPDITYCFIGMNRQSGIICRNDARPNIANSTLYRNSGTAAIECYGSANPRIHGNNISANPFAIQSFSTITLDARSNWWGSVPPDPNLFLGHIEYKPFLTKPNAEAFSYSFK